MASFQTVPVSILESSVGCSRPVQEALQELGFDLKVIDTAADLNEAKVVIFAESGHIESVVQNLQERDLWQALSDYTNSGCPFLGVSTGMHVLFESSDEHPDLELLGILPGSVAKLESWDVSVPHIGWNDISRVTPSISISGGYAEDAPSLYFAHTYCVIPSPDNIPLIHSVTDHGDQRFISTIIKDNITGVQFHPELSGPTGLNFLKEYIDKLQINNFSVDSVQTTSRLEDFGELQALPMTMSSVRVVAVVDNLHSAAKACADGADEVIHIRNNCNDNSNCVNNSNAFVPVPVAAYSSTGTSFESAEGHLLSGASRVVIPMEDAVRAVVDFLTTGIASGDSVIEKLSRRYGAHAVVAEISAARVLLENPMQPFKKPDTANPDTTSASASDNNAGVDAILANGYDEESFPTLGAAHSAGHSSMDAAPTVGDSNMVHIIAEQDEEHDMLAMLRGMGRTVVHLAEEQAALLAVEDAAMESDGAKSETSHNRMTHCWFAVSVPGDNDGPKGVPVVRAIDAVVLAKACEILGAGEILLRGTSTNKAFDRPLLNAVQNAVSISVLAAPTPGVIVTVEDYIEVFERTRVKSVAVAPEVVTVREVKDSLRSAGVNVR